MSGVVPVIAIDGPGGTGKGTVCAQLSAQLGWHLLDSGALYRAVGLAASRAGIDLDDGCQVAELVPTLQIRFTREEGGPDPIRTWIGETDVSADIRTEECGAAASRVAAHQEVRAGLLTQQRAYRKTPGLVADGRDMGTVVFPNAGLKIYLTASVEVRAQRRLKQLKQKGIDVSLRRLFADITGRDARDQGRLVSPMRPADDAVILDTSNRDADAVFAQVLELARQRYPRAVQHG
jgi:cytidylate kinase